MWWFIGLAIGAVAGALIRAPLSQGASLYAAMIAMATADAVAGGTLARLRGAFSASRFLEGMIVNALLACALAFIGQRFEVPLYQAACVALAIRIFENVSKMRWERNSRGVPALDKRE